MLLTFIASADNKMYKLTIGTREGLLAGELIKLYCLVDKMSLMNSEPATWFDNGSVFADINRYA